jgi:hypothetical protein
LWRRRRQKISKALVDGANAPVAEKSLYWIEGTDRRFDGYKFFGVHPELPIEWFDEHVS